MKKIYSEPEIEIRMYPIMQNTILTTSTPEIGDNTQQPDLGDDDVYDPFA